MKLDGLDVATTQVRESLGMRIGGGIGSNEGDTPIYIANIHPHGCIGKSKQLKVSNGRKR